MNLSKEPPPDQVEILLRKAKLEKLDSIIKRQQEDLALLIETRNYYYERFVKNYDSGVTTIP